MATLKTEVGGAPLKHSPLAATWTRQTLFNAFVGPLHFEIGRPDRNDPDAVRVGIMRQGAQTSTRLRISAVAVCARLRRTVSGIRPRVEVPTVPQRFRSDRGRPRRLTRGVGSRVQVPP